MSYLEVPLASREPSVWRARLGAIALLLSVFSTGAVAGVALYRWVERDMRPEPPFGPLGMLGELHLSETQMPQAQAIFDRYRPQLDSVLRESFPKMRAVQDQIDAEIMRILNDTQKRQFELMKKRRGTHPGPPFGGPPMGPPPGGPMGFPGPSGAPMEPPGPMPESIPQPKGK